MSKVIFWVSAVLMMVMARALWAENHRPFGKLKGIKTQQLLKEARAAGETDSKMIYRHFARLVAAEIAEAGDPTAAAAITGYLDDPEGGKLPKTAFAWITHVFAREYYREEIIRTTSELIRFKTFATEVPNRYNPEFIKQKHYLKDLAVRLGLNFRDVDGYLQEIWIGEGEPSFGIMVHSDVQPVDETAWNLDPWSGVIRDGALWGRGTVDDKGPLTVIMYGMKALLDSGLPLQKKLVLLVGTDEESANEDVAYYLQRNRAPDRTIVVDYSYPVICAEKGWCGLWVTLPRRSVPPGDERWQVSDLNGGFSYSIVPAKASATLKPVGIPLAEARKLLQKHIADFRKKQEKARFTIRETSEGLELTAHGKAVHSSVPVSGHNALMDLLVFLEQHLKPAPNSIALLTAFAATYVGLELDGRTLGIAHHDAFMGDVTVSGNLFQTGPDSVLFMANFRIPRGITLPAINLALDRRIEEFSKRYAVQPAIRRDLSEPHYHDPNLPLVQELLKIYNDVSEENRVAQAMGGGTYAHRLPNAVVFGPKLPEEEYRGHQPDEFIRLTTLVRNIEILTHTLVMLGI